ncbi:uncharacterized protein UHOD_06511 [Ustilago sp. UG-2017b]|nr:uncharacterized protein UHOD_06511 [Ustilago sp. UG-2017b]
MYHSILTATFILSLLIILYRSRSLLPHSLTSRLPASLQPPPPSVSLPYATSPPSSGLFSRLFSSLSPTARRYMPVPGFDWSSNTANGLSSTLFDISANIADGDSRSGLDPSGAQDIQTIMQTQGVSFDQARLIRHKQILVKNNIDPQTGLPLDSKAVTSLGGGVPGSSRDGIAMYRVPLNLTLSDGLSGYMLLASPSQLQSRLIPPADSNLINTLYVPPQGTALHNCWIDTAVSTFAEPHTIWPFENTTTLDRDGIPTDIGWLEPGDLGDQVVEALGMDDPTTRPDTPPPAKLLSRPEMTGIRTCKYRIKTTAKFKDIACFWRHCANITYNAAATRLNAINHNSLLPHVYELYQQLRDNRSPFVNRHPHLLKCPVSIQQAAIDEALAARKAILTTYWNKNPPCGPIPTLSHHSKAKDRQNGFFIFLSPSSSTIVFDEGAAVKAPRTVSSVDVHTFLRSAHEDGSLGAPCQGSCA